MTKGLAICLSILLGLLSTWALGFGQIIENPAKPVARNAGRILKLKESVRIEDVGGEYFFRYPRIIKMAPEDLERLATQIGPLLVVRSALGLETPRDVGWKGRTESINDNG